MSQPHGSPVVTYDRDADAAYVQFATEILSDGVDRTICVDPAAINGMVNIDLDADGRIVGLEILDASTLLPSELLRR